MHNMIIFERKGKYYRPHKHEDKGETFQIINGDIYLNGQILSRKKIKTISGDLAIHLYTLFLKNPVR